MTRAAPLITLRVHSLGTPGESMTPRAGGRSSLPPSVFGNNLDMAFLLYFRSPPEFGLCRFPFFFREAAARRGAREDNTIEEIPA